MITNSQDGAARDPAFSPHCLLTVVIGRVAVNHNLDALVKAYGGSEKPETI